MYTYGPKYEGPPYTADMEIKAHNDVLDWPTTLDFANLGLGESFKKIAQNVYFKF
jgi:hypothetical protein